MKNMLGIMLAFTGMDSMADGLGKNSLRPEDIDMTPPKKIIPKGCKTFNINGQEIVAINEKSAIKKYKKLFGNIE